MTWQPHTQNVSCCVCRRGKQELYGGGSEHVNRNMPKAVVQSQSYNHTNVVFSVSWSLRDFHMLTITTFIQSREQELYLFTLKIV